MLICCTCISYIMPPPRTHTYTQANTIATHNCITAESPLRPAGHPLLLPSLQGDSPLSHLFQAFSSLLSFICLCRTCTSAFHVYRSEDLAKHRTTKDTQGNSPLQLNHNKAALNAFLQAYSKKLLNAFFFSFFFLLGFVVILYTSLLLFTNTLL